MSFAEEDLDDVALQENRLIQEYKSKMEEIKNDKKIYKKNKERLEKLMSLRKEKLDKADSLHFEGSRMIEQADELAIEVEEGSDLIFHFPECFLNIYISNIVLDFEIAELKDVLEETVNKMKKTGFQTLIKPTALACSVCFNEYSDENYRMAITCGHEFCKSCIDSLHSTPHTRTNGEVVQMKRCPKCVRSFYPSHVIRMYSA